MGWRKGLQVRARQGIPALLEVDALLQAHGVMAALPGARMAPGLVRFQLAAESCRALHGQGLAWLEGARQARGAVAGRIARYHPWRSGGQALAEIGIEGLPADWPQHAPVFACSSVDRRHWLLLLPTRAQLWLGWHT